ncbi:MAG TPA: hypothetical protein VLM40_05575 [Gemmata sp.]|nr:hypothetical protein [Gemmata sp.]
MNGAILWKELREQGLIGLTLVVLGSGVLAIAAALAEPPVPNAPPVDIIRFLGAGLLATEMLAVTAGMVCGGAVFAAEREAGTIGFLESLPVTRGRLWRAKFLAGFVLAVVQGGLLIGVAGLLGLIPNVSAAQGVWIFSLMAFAWGVFGSTLSRTTLGAVGVAIPAAVLAAVIVLLPLMVIFPTRVGTLRGLQTIGGLLFLFFMFAIPIALSGWIFTASDRQRNARGALGIAPVPLSPGEAAAFRGRPQLGLAAIVWMTVRQIRLPAIVLSGFALICGLSLTVASARPLLMWPALALAAGVVAGVTSFADEQTRGSARFWGEQRLPLGRLWNIKIGAHLLLGMWLLLAIALPLIFRAQFDESLHRRNHALLTGVFHSQLFDELGPNGWKYLVVPAVYGFAAGHLCGLLFRKLAVACGVAGIFGGVGALLWMPSLLAGGIHHWQLWLPPAMLLLTARVLLPAWSADRLITKNPMQKLAAGAALTVLVFAAGISYRILEIPDMANGDADIEYVATIPPIDQNHAGREFRTAAERYFQIASLVQPKGEAGEAVAGGMAMVPRRDRAEDEFDTVIRAGWPDNDTSLTGFFDGIFGENPVRIANAPRPDSEEETCYATAEKAATHPVGVYEPPQTVRLGTPRDALANARRMATALLVRGLKEQAAGRPSSFVKDFRIVLALALTMRNSSIIVAYQRSADIEDTALIALYTWLNHLDHSRQHLSQLHQMREMLETMDPSGPFDPTPHYMAERYTLREAMKSPAQWLPLCLAPPGAPPEAVEQEVDLVNFAWAVPWERERSRRLLGLGIESNVPIDYSLFVGRPGMRMMVRPRLLGGLEEIDRDLRGFRRAAIFKLALRAYRIDHGRYPAKDQLQDLVANKYLRRLPPDPYNENRPLGYRLAGGSTSIDDGEKGEELRFSARQGSAAAIEARPGMGSTRFVHENIPIIWSVGPDRIDDGGTTMLSPLPGARGRREDLIYLFPRGTSS